METMDASPHSAAILITRSRLSHVPLANASILRLDAAELVKISATVLLPPHSLSSLSPHLYPERNQHFGCLTRGADKGLQREVYTYGQGHRDRLGHDQQLRRRHGRRQTEGHRE